MSTQITYNDVIAKLKSLRDLADALPDGTAQKPTLQMGIDDAAATLRKAIPQPGTYVTATGAAAMAGLAAIVGAGGGFFIGQKYEAGKHEKKQLPAAEAPPPAVGARASKGKEPSR